MGAQPGVGETVLALDRVSKRFSAEAAAVDSVSLSIRRGEVFTLLGPSGCGKTTTLRLVAGLERPDAGEITLRDRRGRLRGARASSWRPTSATSGWCSSPTRSGRT